MKKVLAILLALTLILTCGLLAGCKKGGDKSKATNESTTQTPALPAQKLDNEDWVTVQFDPAAVKTGYLSLEATDGSWSVSYDFPISEYALELSSNDYNLISNGYGGQTDIETGEKTLGSFHYQTIRYTQDGKACAFYGCRFDEPLNVTSKAWDDSPETKQVFGAFFTCKANDSALLDTVEAIIASLVINGSDSGPAPTDTPTEVPTEAPTDEPIETPTDEPIDENTYELNAYAKIRFDPEIAMLQGDGSIRAANDSWEATVQFDSDETLYSYTESMYDSHQADGNEIEEKQIGAYTYRILLVPSDQLQVYYTCKTELDNLYGFTFYIEGAYDASLDDFETMLSTLVIDESRIPEVPDSFGVEPND